MRLPLLPMILVIVLAAAIDVYITRSLARRLRRKLWTRLYYISAIIINLALVALICVPRRSGEASRLLTVMWGLYAYLSVYVAKLVFIITDLIACLPKLWRGSRWKWLTRTGASLSVATLLLMAWGALVNRFNIDVTHVTVEIPNLPESFDGYRIAQFSDFHVGTYGNDTSFVSEVVDTLLALKPDMIVFTGDIVNRNATEADPFAAPLSRLKARDGVYTIFGNHDYGDYYDWPSAEAKLADREHLLGFFRKIGWDLLLNESRYIRSATGDSIAVIGVENVGDPPFKVYGDLKAAYPHLSDPVTKILLSHSPYHWSSDIADHRESNVALTLSGHTHAMQMSIGGISPAKWRYKTWGGLYTDSLGRYLYVNIGVGAVGIPTRIGATPEITLITLKRKP